MPAGELYIPAPATEVAIALVTSLLPPGYEDVWVASQVPKDRPNRIVRLTRTAGGGIIASGATDRVNLLAECWGRDEAEAEELANVVRAVLNASAGLTVRGTFVRWWRESGGPYRWPDESGQERWQLTGVLDLKIGG